MRTTGLAGVVCSIVCAVAPLVAHAGGYEVPDNGTEALGRGGAFVAKADDGTALQYNIAGLARQRGTRITLDLNLIYNDIAFTRAGVYPGDPSDMRTPFAGQPYPTVHNSDNLFPAPFLGVSTDFGWFKRWTFGFGIYGPPSAGKRNYNVNGETPPAEVTLPNGMKAPGPARYDIARTDLLIIFPTLAAAFHATRWLDVGLALQMVYGSFNLMSASTTPLGRTNCPTPDFPGCDSYADIKTSGYSVTGLVSILAHPTDWIDVGATYRPPVFMTSEGTLHAVPPPLNPIKLADSPVTFESNLPMWLRVGGRVIKRWPDGSERADLEVDLTWENWSAEQKSHIYSPDFTLGPGGELNADVLHKYRDTFGVRVGGAYNHPFKENLVATGRLGAYFDSAATHYANTRLDFNTAAKYGLTVGGGVRWRGLQVNLAYAFVYSPARDVTSSETLALSGINGNPVPMRDAFIAVGNGRYVPSTHLISLGVTVDIGGFRTARAMPAVPTEPAPPAAPAAPGEPAAPAAPAAPVAPTAPGAPAAPAAPATPASPPAATP